MAKSLLGAFNKDGRSSHLNSQVLQILQCEWMREHGSETLTTIPTRDCAKRKTKERQVEGITFASAKEKADLVHRAAVGWHYGGALLAEAGSPPGRRRRETILV